MSEGGDLPAFSFLVDLERSSRYAHSFGSQVDFKGLFPPGQIVPAQLVLTLDLGDPRLAPLGMDCAPFLYLVFPCWFRSGGPFAYRIWSRGGGITFLEPRDAARWTVEEGLSPENFPDVLPRRPAELIDELPGTYNDNQKIYVSDRLPTPQVHNHTIMDCAFCGCRPIRQVACVPSSPLNNYSMWGENGEGMYAVFFYCPSCKAITTFGEGD